MNLQARSSDPVVLPWKHGLNVLEDVGGEPCLASHKRGCAAGYDIRRL